MYIFNKNRNGKNQYFIHTKQISSSHCTGEIRHTWYSSVHITVMFRRNYLLCLLVSPLLAQFAPGVPPPRNGNDVSRGPCRV